MGPQNIASADRRNAANRRYIDYEIRLNAICDRIHEADRLEMALDEIQPGLMGMFDVERLTVFERTGDGRSLKTRFTTVTDAEPITFSLGFSSIAGFVAMRQESVVIDDVYDPELLAGFHEDLEFDYEADQAAGLLTRSVLAVPISTGDAVLGVLQLANKLTGTFSSQDIHLAEQLATVLGQRLLLEEAPDPGEGAAAADAGDEDVDLAVELVP